MGPNMMQEIITMMVQEIITMMKKAKPNMGKTNTKAKPNMGKTNRIPGPNMGPEGIITMMKTAANWFMVLSRYICFTLSKSRWCSQLC